MSLAINLKKKEGPPVLRRLCSNADVLIEPYRVGEFTGLYDHCDVFFVMSNIYVCMYVSVCILHTDISVS